MKTITCAICGASVEVADRSRRAKYCSACRKEVTKIYSQRREARRRAARSTKQKIDDASMAGDSVEDIATCLSCPLPECAPRSRGCGLNKRPSTYQV